MSQSKGTIILKQTLFIFLIFSLLSRALAKPDICAFEDPASDDKPRQQKGFQFSQQQWSDKSFFEAEYTSVSLNHDNTINYTHSLPELSVIVLKNSRWSLEAVKHHLQKTADVFSQCQIKIHRAHIVQAQSPAPEPKLRLYRDCLNPDLQGTYHVAKSTPPMPGPRVYFIEDFIVGPVAIAPFNHTVRGSSLENTAWITFDFRLRLSPLHHPFEIVAHELGHLLLRQGHTEAHVGHNLMSGHPDLLSNKLSLKQCQDLHKSPLLSSLPSPNNTP